MIEYVKGELADLTPAMAVVDCHGVGYGVNISLNTYSAIQGKRDIKLYIYEAIREDAFVLWGFASKQERELFLLLISVSGIGGNMARMILSSLTPSELVDVISSGNDRLLKTVKGIGLKTAQRIIVELRDKISLIGSSNNDVIPGKVTTGNISNEVMEEAVSALTMLGFQVSASQKVVVSILKEDPSLPVEKVIKMALKQL
ncbi:MAG: Holliday junction branch migration protein RuvA [Bacteroidaceae bacterium]|nr:Holliday junction branch migration protein RuvA [Bacteroidaceae bacterium]